MAAVAPSRLSPDQIVRVRSEHPITDVLQRAGVDWPAGPARGEAMIRCPTPGHEDATPSCIVHPDTGTFHCFGCGAHGDVFALIREITGITSLAQAAALLDSRRPITRSAGVPVPRSVALPVRPSADGPDLGRTSRDRVLEINAAAWSYLTEERRADQARAYLARRGIDTFRLEARTGTPLAGYTPASRTGLTDHLCRVGYELDELVDAGWTVRRPDGVVDRFHRRVLLPVRDTGGGIAGVIGRDVTDHARSKYLNTPRTLAYSKGELLYRPTPAPRLSPVVIVCEGPLDALAVAAVAATTGRGTVFFAVSPSGTALTTTQALQVAALSPRDPIICTDADAAGATAAATWANALREHDRSPRTVTLPTGHDPASWLAEHGPTGLDVILELALDAPQSAEPAAILAFQRRPTGRDLGIPS